MGKNKARDNVSRDRYEVLGKDEALCYMFVGPKQRENFYGEGWAVCKRSEHPNLKVPSARNQESEDGLFEVGPFVLMCIAKEKAKAIEKEADDAAKINANQTLGDSKVTPLTIDITQNR